MEEVLARILEQVYSSQEKREAAFECEPFNLSSEQTTALFDYIWEKDMINEQIIHSRIQNIFKKINIEQLKEASRFRQSFFKEFWTLVVWLEETLVGYNSKMIPRGYLETFL